MTGTGHRVDGVEKVTGRALYVDDMIPERHGFPCLSAVAVRSTVAKGWIASMDVKDASTAAGVRAVMTYQKAPRLQSPTAVTMAEIGQLLPMRDDRVSSHGQCVAVVVADTALAVHEGAPRVVVIYT